MSEGAPPASSVRRRLLLPLLGVAHLALVAAAMAGRPAVTEAPRAAMASFNIAAPLDAAPPPTVMAAAAIPVAAEVTAPAVEIASGDATPSVAGCALTDAVQTALRADPQVHAALAGMPRAARSVAGAVMLWDGRWAAPARLGGDAVLEPLRAAVRARVAAGSLECREARLAGPRLLYVDGEDGSTVLAFGSGDWAWADLLDT